MVPEYKIRQQLYSYLNPTPSDFGLDIPYVANDGISLVSDIIDYFYNTNHVISYPTKSYAVALIYAHSIQTYFNVDLIVALDSSLLFHNDPHYVPYDLAPNLYDTILRYLDLKNAIAYNVPQVSTTIQYFNEEFFINTNPYFDNANLHK